MNLFGGIKVFTQEEMYRIHQEAIKILENVGMELHLSRRSLEKLQEAGLKVDFGDRRVRMTDEPVLETIRQLSGAESAEITEDGTAKPPQPCRVARRLVPTTGANTGYIFDCDRWEMRPATHEDMYRVIKLNRSLVGELSNPHVVPQDVPGGVAFIHNAAAAMKYCEHPSPPDCNGVQDKIWIERVMRAAGVWGPNRLHTSGIYVKSPLQVIGRDAELLEYQSSRGQLSGAGLMPLLGASGPVTIAGIVALMLAEQIGLFTIIRLMVDPPNNVFKPRSIGDDMIIMDLRRGAYAVATPETFLMRLAIRQIAGEFYKFPGHCCCGGRFFTDAKEPGIQAMMEKALYAMCDISHGFYSYDPDPVASIGIVGLLNSGLSLCMEQSVIDMEMIKFLQRFVEGVQVNDETMAKNLITKVGPGGSFIGTPHTIRHYRKEMWFPELLHRGSWDAWVASGRRSPLDLAREKVKEALKADLPHFLDADQEKEVDKVVQKAEKALLGTTTGILP